ncbi:MAG TPA: ABC transporter substrate-binding protein [Rhodocyclaceae bacterium]|nr:ABC transporter substrate-binding protein [Rhodocyclaceae bacterium]
MEKPRFLKSGINRLLVSSICCLAGFVSLQSVASAEVVKVGMILTYSGPDTSLGQLIDRGASLYIKLHGNDLPPGTKVEIIRRDDTGVNPAVAKRLAQELIMRDHIDILTGGQWTPNTMAIETLANQAKIPYVVMGAGGSKITANAPYVIRTSFTLWQSCYPLGQWAAKKGYKTAYTLVSDFAPGHDAEAAFTKAFTDGGGKVIGSVRIPMQATDYLPYMLKVKEAKPDVLFLFNPGGPVATAYMKALANIGISGSKIQVIGSGDITTDEELPNMGRAPLGVITVDHYSAAATRKPNQEFVAAWKKAYGANSTPNFFSVGGWDGMEAIYDAIRAQKGKVTAAGTMVALRHWSDPNAPQGPISIDPKTGDLIQHEYVRRTEEQNGHLANVEIETLPATGDPEKQFGPKH